MHRQSPRARCRRDVAPRNECRVAFTADTPPSFIWHTVEDQSVPVNRPLVHARALGAAGVPCALHSFPAGWRTVMVWRTGTPPERGRHLPQPGWWAFAVRDR